MCISFLKSRWLRDLVFPAVIRAPSVSRRIAECQSGKKGRGAPASCAEASPARRRRTQKQVKRRRESGNDRAGASYRRGVTPAPAPVWSSASVPSIQTGRDAAGACAPWSFRSLSLRLAEGAEVAETAPATERRHGSLKEKRVATQKSCPEHLIKASCRPFSHKHTCAFHLGFTFRPGFEALSQPSGSSAGTTKAH